jgi:hypothetical protein
MTHSVTKGDYGRSSPSKGSYKGDHKLLHSLSPEARARYESVWQRLGERAIALDGDPFDEGKNPNYDAYPVEQSMPLDEVRRCVPGLFPFFSFFLFYTHPRPISAHPFLPVGVVRSATAGITCTRPWRRARR